MLNSQRIAYVNLSDESFKIEPLSFEITKKFLGGRGINSYLLYKHLKKGIDPLGKDNVLIVGAGLLCGAKGVTLARATITAKSPETGFFGDANIGGQFGATLKRAAVSHLLIQGKAKKPSYLFIDNSSVSIKDANFVWGKDVFETQKLLKDVHGQDAQIICIGQAGENLVRFAAVMHKVKNAAARTGMGAVMGSKNLKAIVVKGSSQVKANDEAKFDALMKELLSKLNDEFLAQDLKKYGTSHLYNIINVNIGMGRAFNGEASSRHPKLADSDISGDNLKKYYIKASGCSSCPIACQKVYRVNSGRYQGLENEGPEYGVLGHFGPMLGIKKLEDVLKLNETINRLGLDASSSSNVIAWMIELYEKGIIDDHFTKGQRLEWGNADLIIRLLEDIALRRGFGEILADGIKENLERLPKEAADYAAIVKFLPQSDPVDLRYLTAYALGDSVATRGADHLRSRAIWEAFGLDEKMLEDIYGGKVSPDNFSYEGKGRVIWWWESYLAMFDCLGMCKLLAFHAMPGVFSFDWFSQVINAAIATNLTKEDVFKIGDRVTTIERMFITREGVTRSDDYPSKKYLKPLELQEGLSEEEKKLKIDLDKYDQMLDEYYQLHGWDKNGIPTEDKKKELELV